MAANEVAMWQGRMEDAFRGPSGIVGERVRKLALAERNHGPQALQHLWGYTVLMDCFQDFALQVFEEAVRVAPAPSVIAFSVRAASFRRMRAGLNSFWDGYYYDASASLRAVFENVLFLGAVHNGYVTEDDLFGFTADIDFASDTESSIDRKREQHRRQLDAVVRSRMRGRESGLSEDDQRAIGSTLALLHSHVHRCESTLIQMMLDIHHTKSWPEIVPELNAREMSYFTNLCLHAAWAMLRLLPLLPTVSKFSAEVQNKYRLLDESFRFCFERMVAQLPEGPWPSVIRFIDHKFAFAGTQWAEPCTVAD